MATSVRDPTDMEGSELISRRRARRCWSTCDNGRGVSGWYRRRDAACPVGTGGGTRHVRFARREVRGVSGWYGVAEEGRGIDHHVKAQELKALGAIGAAPAHFVQHPERLLLPARRRAVVHGQPRLDGHLADGHGVSD